MKKYLLLLSCSLLAAGTAGAMDSADRLKAVKDVFVKEFQKMDTDKDGKLSKEEYLTYQFENLRADVIEADGFDSPSTSAAKKTAPKPDTELAGISPALQEMADYDLELDDDLLLDDEPQKLTKADVMPDAEIEEEPLPEIDLSLSEEDSFKKLLDDMEKEDNAAAAEEKAKADAKPKIDLAAREKHINFMLETIKNTLPKKVDEITTWTDIEYKDKVITYIYQADINTSSYSATEKATLKKSVESETCPGVYSEMCPKIKPMFIDEGINMRIRYQDKTGQEITSCEFNEKTCQ